MPINTTTTLDAATIAAMLGAVRGDDNTMYAADRNRGGMVGLGLTWTGTHALRSTLSEVQVLMTRRITKPRVG